MSSRSNGSSDTGVNIALAGLAIQVITLFCFAVLCIDYAFRSRSTWRTMPFPPRYVVFLMALSLALVFIFTRCCYRIYELKDGYSENSKALRDEVLFDVLEAA